MSKKVDWDNMYKGTLRGLRAPKGAAYSSRKEQVAQAVSKMKQAEDAQARFAQLEPHLRKSLLEHMVARKPITVIQPMVYITEGLAKSAEEDEIDRSYYNRPQNSERISSYQIMQKSIQPGTQLTFVRVNQSLGQWIFKSSSGEEIEIYDKPVIMMPGALGQTQAIQNPGFWGLLCNTNIYADLMESGGDEE